MLDGLTAAGVPLWREPQVSSVGRLPMRAPLLEYPDDASARAVPPTASFAEAAAGGAAIVDLDGEWDFRLFDRPDDVPPAAVSPGSSEESGGVDERGDGRSGWYRLGVPGSWPVQGAQRGAPWDPPQYTNIRMPFDEVFPDVPDANPTGVYRREVTVPADWAGRRIVLWVGGAASVVFVYVDGVCVGMAKDSRLPSEFDVGAHVRPGQRCTLALVVVKWSDASHIEDQDQWWAAGLIRGVALRATDPVFLADVATSAGWRPDEGATLLWVRATVGFGGAGIDGAGPTKGWSVTAQLETLAGRRLGALEPRSHPKGRVPHATHPYIFRGHDVVLAAPTSVLAKVRPWSAEDPQLYRVLVRLHDPDGKVRAVVAQRVGFRSVEVGDRQLRINGAPVGIRGMNRHDDHPDRGAAVTIGDMRDDLVAMKRANTNAVRCSHYPNDHRFYDLCDELGLYVVDEANIESHAWNLSLCHDPRYHAAIVERVARMVLRDRNHPSVIAWSLGNESGDGAGHDAAAAWVRRVDPSRPLHYEGGVMEDLYGAAPTTDIVCPMYTSVEDIMAWATRAEDRRRPLILCEFSHAMGNSNGGLDEYVEAFETVAGLQGGFIWEWKDHGLRQRLPDGRERFAYGGQFGDDPHDGNFVADGIVGPDLTPYPGLREWAWLCRPVVTEAAPGGVRRGLAVTNRQWFVDTSGLAARWELTADGEVVASGRLDVDAVSPRTTTRVQLPATVRDALAAAAGRGEWPGRRVPSAGAELHLNVTWSLRSATEWASRGHVVAWDQMALGVVRRGRTPTARSGAVAPASRRSAAPPVLERDRAAAVTRLVADLGGSNLVVHIDDASASVAQVTLGDDVLVERGPRLELFRAAVDNDGSKLAVGSDDPWQFEFLVRPLFRWLALGLDRPERRGVRVTARRTASGAPGDGGVGVRLVSELVLTDDLTVRHTTDVTLDATGELRFDEAVRLPAALDDIPRVGVSFEVPAPLGELTWLGLGPDENYPDRCASSVVGRFSCGVDDTYVPYLMPQHHGTRGGLRWFTLTGAGGPGVRVAPAVPGAAPQWFSARRLTDADLWSAVDWTGLPGADELARRPVTVNLDAVIRGLGSASVGPDTPERFRVHPGWHRWSWSLRPQR